MADTTGTTSTVASTGTNAANPVKSELAFTKEQLAGSTKYAHKTDLINAVLKDGKTYTIAALDAAIKEFLEREAK